MNSNFSHLFLGIFQLQKFLAGIFKKCLAGIFQKFLARIFQKVLLKIFQELFLGVPQEFLERASRKSFGRSLSEHSRISFFGIAIRVFFSGDIMVIYREFFFNFPWVSSRNPPGVPSEKHPQVLYWSPSEVYSGNLSATEDRCIFQKILPAICKKFILEFFQEFFYDGVFWESWGSLPEP